MDRFERDTTFGTPLTHTTGGARGIEILDSASGVRRWVGTGRARLSAHGAMLTPKSRLAVRKSWKPRRAPAVLVTVPFAMTPPSEDGP